VPVNIPLSDSIRDPLQAELCHQPIEDRGGITLFDGGQEAVINRILAKAIDPGFVTGDLADLANERSSPAYS
jgi:hypothetical protein